MASRHARLAPSTFKPREICPSFTSNVEDSAASRRGDVLHDLMEKYGHKAVKAKEFADLGERDRWQLEQICGYIEPIEKRKGWEFHREYEFNLKPLNIPHCDLGTGDLVAVHRGLRRGDLLDYKFGFWDVDDVEVNIQQWLYALGVFITWTEVDTLTAHILQPARDTISVHTFTRQDMARMLVRAQTIAARVLDEDLKVFNPVFENCLWCDYKSKCTALQDLALKAAKYARLQVPETKLDLTSLSTTKDGKTLAQAYDLADLLEKWAKDVRRVIAENVQAHAYDVPGHQLVVKSGKRTIIDTELARKILKDRWRVSDKDFLKIVDISISSLLGLIKERSAHGEKEKRANEVLNSLADEGIVVSSNPVAYLKRTTN